jgi:hypothetical protein
MAVRTGLARDGRHRRQEMFIDPLGVLRQALALVRFRLAITATSRRQRARLGMLGVPLAIVAALVSEWWWTILPLTVCAWWWAPQDTGWEWVGAVGRGLVGAEWALIGSSALARFPDHVLLVGVFWLLGAGLLGACGSGGAGRRAVMSEHSPSGGEVRPSMRLNRVPSFRKRFAMHLAVQTKPHGVKRRR